VRDTDGSHVGQVATLITGGAQDRLVIDAADGTASPATHAFTFWEPAIR
jgi:hypothetical protein